MTDENDAPARRRSPSASELVIWRDYVETSEEVKRTLSTALHETSGISPGDYAVMLALSEAPDKTLRSSDVADVVGWERSRLSHHLRRMEERGLITRGAVDSDARGAGVTLTDTGSRIFRSSSASHLRLIREVFVDAFTPDQLDVMQTLTATLHQHLDSIQSSRSR